MEERQRVLIGLGAAAAANCVPCFQHYYKKARTIQLTEKEIQETVAIGNQMKTGAIMAVQNSIDEIMGGDGLEEKPCGPAPQTSCCG